MGTAERAQDRYPEGMSSLIQFLRGLSEQRYWGTISLKFEGGQPVYVKEERGWKIQELPSGTPRYKSNASSE